MRACYLNVGNYDWEGCRGGVSSHWNENGYELEVGEQCYASTAMVALCAHIDEVTEYLRMTERMSPMASMILLSYADLQTKLDNDLQLQEKQKLETEDSGCARYNKEDKA
jgi:hypothetical protein